MKKFHSGGKFPEGILEYLAAEAAALSQGTASTTAQFIPPTVFDVQHTYFIRCLPPFYRPWVMTRE
jgi:hypothetical protein